jgi:hypothetical protein
MRIRIIGVDCFSRHFIGFVYIDIVNVNFKINICGIGRYYQNGIVFVTPLVLHLRTLKRKVYYSDSFFSGCSQALRVGCLRGFCREENTLQLAFEVTKPSKEKGAGENKENIVLFSHLDFAEKRTLFQWSLD